MDYISLSQTPNELTTFLQKKGWLSPKDAPVVSIDRAGEGNMNVVLRVKTGHRSFILKQSRPYVEKYRQIPAPLERIAVEHRFYQDIHSSSQQKHFPKILGYDPRDHILMLEDLGRCDDMTSCYAEREIKDNQIHELIHIAKTIHTTPTAKGFPKNLALRKLNHQHIFELPFMTDNGFSLDDVQSGLQALSMPYKRDRQLKEKVKQLGERYLGSGKVLIHGDYYPGSWMTCMDKIYVIDPEFCFIGLAEFDLGVMAAHLIMATMKTDYLDTIGEYYGENVSLELTSQIAGTEIIRRIIGLAQLPLSRTLDEKAYLLQEARNLVIAH